MAVGRGGEAGSAADEAEHHGGHGDEAEAIRKTDPDRGGIAGQEIRIGDHICERACPHRQADLSVFGAIDGNQLVCTLHGWRFDLDTGECLTATDRKLRIRRATPAD